MSHDASENTEYVPPLGPRFSQLYVERASPTADKPRLRFRIAAFFKNEFYDYARLAGQEIESGIGTDHLFNGYASSVANYLRQCSAADFRDTITMIYRAIGRKHAEERYTSHLRKRSEWRDFCRDVFVEENVAFRVDDECVVRPFVDDEFTRAATSVLRGLDDARLSAVRAEAKKAISDLGGREPDFKGSVRAIFEAIEIYAKLAVTTCNVSRLNRNIVAEHLVPEIIRRAEFDGPAVEAAKELGESMVRWIQACHIYRHGQGVGEPAPPPPDVAIVLVSTGMSFLRWLLDSVPLAAQRTGQLDTESVL
jgi:hypothetical protein